MKLQLIYVLLSSQNLISCVPAESISHLKSYFSKSSFNKYDVYCDHGHP